MDQLAQKYHAKITLIPYKFATMYVLQGDKTNTVQTKERL